MWIDFKLYFYVRIHKHAICYLRRDYVVNWFQIVFLREDSQVAKGYGCGAISCELISNCIFTWGFTSESKGWNEGSTLWIDFKLYFYVRIHKPNTNPMRFAFVVNWFQIVFLREDSQVGSFPRSDRFGCELISNCIFTWGFTSLCRKCRLSNLLWIDFKLYFYVRIHK